MPALKLSDNGKVRFKRRHFNSIGLLYGLPENGGTCPSATSGKGGCLEQKTGRITKTCYMDKITRLYPALYDILEFNTSLVKGKSEEEITEVYISTLQEFVRLNPEKELWFFRWFYSGDIEDDNSCNALITACKTFPEIRFWLYTRSHKYISKLANVANLAVYLSLDRINEKEGLKTYQELGPRNNVGLAYMGNPTIEGEKFIKCPETFGVIENTSTIGACSKCKLCFTFNEKIKLRNIMFKVHY